MDNYNQSTATTEQATEFVESLFVMGADTPAATEPPTVIEPVSVKPAATKEPAAKPTEKSAGTEQIAIVPLTEIDPFPSHPFQIRNDEEMTSLADSIKEYGVLTPAIVRKTDKGRYELVSGHRRKYACELAGIAEMPVIVRDMTKEQAIVAMADSNLQRERVLPSEKAWAFKLKMDALKKQGKRTDLTSTPVARKSQSTETAELVGAVTGDSKDTVRRYIRLTNLIAPLLKMVDENAIAFRPAVEISYLPKQSQKDLLAAMEAEACTPSHAQAIKLKAFSQECKLTPEIIASIMQEQKSNQVEKIKIPRDALAKYFKKDDTPDTITQTIIRALELLRKRERSRDDAR
jgi:ParB family chromosome partitioning protein